MVKETLVACPQCGKEVAWSKDNRYRPFCSERCKMIDLGQWANEGYRIPGEPPPDQPEESSGQA
jgi:endogenous inhibitor of DNA gyrase (YacG/DUF329 family)